MEPLDQSANAFEPATRLVDSDLDRLELLRVIAVTRGIALAGPSSLSALAALLADQLFEALFGPDALAASSRLGAALDQVASRLLCLAAGHISQLSPRALDRLLAESAALAPTHSDSALRAAEEVLAGFPLSAQERDGVLHAVLHCFAPALSDPKALAVLDALATHLPGA